MAMSYSSLIAPKGNSGSIANFTNYTKLDLPPIIDEAQALLYSMLRCREMMTGAQFTASIGQSYQPLPTGFLDPIGRMVFSSFNTVCRHKDSGLLAQQRNYTELSGTLGANPFTTALSSASVTVALTNHGFSQDSVFNTSGATLFNGVTIAGTFPITGIVDANDFTIDITSLGALPSAAGAGGGSAVAYLCDNLCPGVPVWFGIWNENFYFDVAFVQATIARYQYYRSLPLLSSTNQTNFLTNRYPHLMRNACMTAAADFMKDDTEYQKGVTKLSSLITGINAENDMQYRGLEIESDTP